VNRYLSKPVPSLSTKQPNLQSPFNLNQFLATVFFLFIEDKQ